jgi:hypothetical protein
MGRGGKLVPIAKSMGLDRTIKPFVKMHPSIAELAIGKR